MPINIYNFKKKWIKIVLQFSFFCRRSVVSNSATTMADPFITTIVTDTTTSMPYISTTEGRFNMSSVVSMQVVDMEGFVVEKVTTVQTIRLRLQAFSTAGMLVCLFVVWFIVPVNYFSVMLEWSHHNLGLYPPAKRSFMGVYCFQPVRHSVIP